MGIKSVILETIQGLNEKRTVLGRSLFLPAVIYIALNIWDFSNDQTQEASPLVMITGLISFLLSVIMAVTIHRVVLREEPSTPQWGSFKWTQRETKFALYGILMIILVLLAGLPMVLFLKVLPIVGIGMSMFLITFVLSRFSLVFPAIALDHDISFRKSFELTKNHQPVMIFVVIILPIIFMIPILPLFMSVGEEGMNLLYVSYFLMVYALSAVCTVTALSVTYKQILREYEKGPQ